MKIETYNGRFDNEIIALILSIQNDETKIGLSLQEQPDLLDIQRYYQWSGGEFWVALSDDRVIGTIVLMLKEKNCDVLKNFLWRRRFAHKICKRRCYFARRSGQRLLISHIGFMKKLVLKELIQKNYQCNIPIQTGIAYYICWIYKVT